MASKPHTLELQVLQSSSEKTVSTIGLSPPSPNTPTICLSEAPKPNSNRNGFHFPNQGFIADDELSLDYGVVLSEQERKWKMSGIGLLDTASLSSMPVASEARIAFSPGSKSLQTVTQSQTMYDGLHIHRWPGTHGSNSSLTIPQFNSKRHSLPITDTRFTPI
ncbi:uncharacterized protein LOC117123073 [Anneissia japonica]|uniref:uncharacterized protein LOC117123073 n=1 Tax=Anneissia japonica TaxID=1529436 RepID=UPI0014259309|nr:uncharacterized protein LOC117123073 [Anneissia japonica]